MHDSHVIRCYAYVRAPYERAREVLRADPVSLLQRATSAAERRADEIRAGLHARVGKLDLGTDAVIGVREVNEDAAAPGNLGPRTRLLIEWRAARVSALFPHMKAQLSMYPLSADETQLDFMGSYDPPLGIFGDAVDAVVGRRIAEATVYRFVEDVAARLRADLGLA